MVKKAAEAACRLCCSGLYFHGITVLPLGYLQHDAERDAVLSFPADAVRLLHIGAPAVDAADAAGCAQIGRASCRERVSSPV